MSAQEFLLALIVVGYLVRRLALALPLPPEVVKQYLARESQRDDGKPLLSGSDDDLWRSRSDDADDDDTGDYGVNIDGTPMLDDTVDIYGNTFGTTDDWLSNDWMSNE